MSANDVVDTTTEAEIHAAVLQLAATVDRILVNLTAKISAVIEEDQ